MCVIHIYMNDELTNLKMDVVGREGRRDLKIKEMVLGEVVEVMVLLVQLLSEFVAEFLAVPGLVVLEPVKDVFALNLTVEREVGGDLLYLGGARSSHTSPVQFLQYHQLLWSWTPSCVAGRAHLHYLPTYISMHSRIHSWTSYK